MKAAVTVRLDRQKDANAVEKIPTYIAKAENRMNRLEKKFICPYMSIVQPYKMELFYMVTC